MISPPVLETHRNRKSLFSRGGDARHRGPSSAAIIPTITNFRYILIDLNIKSVYYGMRLNDPWEIL